MCFGWQGLRNDYCMMSWKCARQDEWLMLYAWLNNLSVLHLTLATFLVTVSKTQTSPLPRMLPSSAYQSWTLYYKNSYCRITFLFVCWQGLWNNELKMCKTRRMVDVVYIIAQQLRFWTLDSCNISWDPFLENYDIKFDQAPRLFSTLWIQKIKHAPSAIASKITRFHNLAAPVVRCCSVSHFSLPWKMRIASANVMPALVYMSLLAWFCAYALHLGLCDAFQNLQVRFFWHLLHLNLVLILWKYIPFLSSCPPNKTTNVDDVDWKREECQLTSLMTKHINALFCSTFRLRMFRVSVFVLICIWGFNLLELPAKVVVWI